MQYYDSAIKTCDSMASMYRFRSSRHEVLLSALTSFVGAGAAATGWRLIRGAWPAVRMFMKAEGPGMTGKSSISLKGIAPPLFLLLGVSAPGVLFYDVPDSDQILLQRLRPAFSVPWERKNAIGVYGWDAAATLLLLSVAADAEGSMQSLNEPGVLNVPWLTTWHRFRHILATAAAESWTRFDDRGLRLRTEVGDVEAVAETADSYLKVFDRELFLPISRELAASMKGAHHHITEGLCAATTAAKVGFVRGVAVTSLSWYKLSWALKGGIVAAALPWLQSPAGSLISLDEEPDAPFWSTKAITKLTEIAIQANGWFADFLRDHQDKIVEFEQFILGNNTDRVRFENLMTECQTILT